jgi:ankyrin repeat protein
VLSLYVHLRNDGGIFVVRGTGEQALITEADLMKEVDQLIERGGRLLYSRDDPDRRPSDEIERLFRAIVDRSPAQLQLLERPHRDAPGPNEGATTLMQASFTGQHAVVADLLHRGSPVDDHDKDGYTALMYAAQAGQVPCIEALLGGGANPNEQDRDGNTPLMFAAQHGNRDAIDILLAAGADPRPRGKSGFRAADFARQNGHFKMVDRLESFGDSAKS